MEKPEISPRLIIISIVVTFMIIILSGYASAQNLLLNNNTTIIEKSTFSSSSPSPPPPSPIIPPRNETIIINETMLREQEARIIPNQYMVKLKENELANTTSGLDTILQNLTTKIENIGGEVLHVYKITIKGFAIKVPNNQTLNETLGILKADPNVESIVQDQYIPIRSQRLPTGIDRVAGDHSTTLSGNNAGFPVNADIAIIDTGIDLDHIDLNVYRNINFLSPLNPADDTIGHGTHVAGIAAAKDDQEGVVGIAPGARLWAIEACDALGCKSTALLKAIEYVTENREEIDVVNISEGCSRIPNHPKECGEGWFDILQDAISKSAQQGVVYAVAAGNDGVDAKDDWPASNPNVIAVSAMVDFDGKCGGLSLPTPLGWDDTFAKFSNFGPDIDVAAPGVDIGSTIPNNSYSSDSGTSQAAPHVAGAVALYKAYNPDASLSEIRNIIINRGSIRGSPCDGLGDGGYFTGDRDNIPEPLLYAKPIQQFTISVEAQISSQSSRTPYHLLVQGHYACRPLDNMTDTGISFNGFLEGQLTNRRVDPETGTRDLLGVSVESKRDRYFNTLITVTANDRNIGARLTFQGTIDCSKPVITPIAGQNCMWVNPARPDLICPSTARNVSAASLGLQQ